MAKHNELIKNYGLKEVLSSCHINFLFGAGINGDFFPQMLGFSETISLIKEKDFNSTGNLETDLTKLNEDDRKEVLECFIDEFNSFYTRRNYNKKSYKNMTSLVKQVFSLVDKTENTIESMSKINVFTFNYDDFIEEIIDNEGIFVNVISPKKLATLKYHNVITKAIDTYHVVPSFTVSKMHGQVENRILRMDDVVLPGHEKFNDVLNKNFFQLLFSMKTELLKDNSVLLVLGYSWSDEHANHIVKDCINNGLTVIWFKYKKEESLPFDFDGSDIIVIEPTDPIQDTTLTCSEVFNEVLAL